MLEEIKRETFSLVNSKAEQSFCLSKYAAVDLWITRCFRSQDQLRMVLGNGCLNKMVCRR